MEYDDFKEYVQEHWNNVIDIVEEGKLADGMMKGMIKFSQSDNVISKNMRKRGMKQALKYQNKKRPKLKKELESITSEIIDIVVLAVEKNNDDVKSIDVVPNSNGDAVTVKIKFKPGADYDKTSHKISDYLVKCCDKNQIESYDFWFNENSGLFTAKIK